MVKLPHALQPALDCWGTGLLFLRGIDVLSYVHDSQQVDN